MLFISIMVLMAQIIQTVLTQGVQTAVILKVGLKNILFPTSFPFIKMTKNLKILKNLILEVYRLSF